MDKASEEDKKMYTIREAAVKLGISVDTARSWVKEGTLESIILRKGKGKNTIRIPEAVVKGKLFYEAKPVKDND